MVSTSSSSPGQGHASDGGGQRDRTDEGYEPAGPWREAGGAQAATAETPKDAFSVPGSGSPPYRVRRVGRGSLQRFRNGDRPPRGRPFDTHLGQGSQDRYRRLPGDQLDLKRRESAVDIQICHE
jgi:hypothetical protein